MLHVVEEVEAHDVEAEAIDFVLGGVEHQGVDHELFHHAVLAGGVGAAGAFFEIAVGVEAVVVVRDDFVEVGVGAFAGGVGVVEDDVLYDAEAGVVDAFDHGAVFADAVRWVDGVGAFGGHVVDGVISPVVGIAALDGGDGGLLLRCRRADIRRGRR